jgi:hypothetical protein
MHYRMLAQRCLLTTIALAAGCSPERNRTTSKAAEVRPIEPMDEQFEAPSPRDTVPEVMQAKLAHAQAVLEGIVQANYVQIEGNAAALKRISQGGDWLVQESPAYFAFSSEFRNICDDLVNHARGQNLQAVAVDYVNLTNSCLACHSFLRRERQTKDIHGRISMRTP